MGRAVVVLVLVAVAATFGIAPVPAGGQTPPTPNGQRARIQVASIDPVVPATGNFTVLVDVIGVPAGTSLAVDIYPRIDTPDRLVSGVESDPSGSLATFDVIPIDVDATTAPHRTGFSIALGTPDQPRPPTAWTRNLSEPGVHPVKIRLRDHDGATLHQVVTYLVRMPDPGDAGPPAEATSVALLLRFTDPNPEAAPDDITADPAPSEETLSQLDQLTTLLTTHPDLPASVVVEPDLATRLESTTADPVSGEDGAVEPPGGEPAGEDPDDPGSAPGRLDGLAAQLTGPHRELLPAPFASVDPASLVNAGMTDELAHQLDLGRQILTATLTEPTRGPLPLERPVDARTVAALADVDVTTVVGGPAVFDERPALTHPHVAPVADHPSTSAMAIDEAFDLATALGGPDADLAVSRTFGHLVALADLAGDADRTADGSAPSGSVSGASGPAAQVVVDVDMARIDLDRLVMLIELIGAAPDRISLTTVSSLFEARHPAGEANGPNGPVDPPGDPTEDDDDALLLAPARPQDPGPLRSRLAEARALTASYASMGFDGDALWPLDRALARSLSVDRSAADRLALIARVEDLVRGELATISVPERERVTLGTRDAEFPLTIRSGMGRPARVVIELDSSDRLRLPQERMEVVLDGDRTIVPVPVQALATGDTPLSITVRTPDGEVLLAETTYAIRSTAVSGVGILLTIGAGAFLVVWWGRHIFRHRRSRTAAP